MPKIKALSNTQIGLDDLIIVKNVIDILTKERFDSPTSAAVIKPHGIETPVVCFVYWGHNVISNRRR